MPCQMICVKSTTVKICPPVISRKELREWGKYNYLQLRTDFGTHMYFTILTVAVQGVVPKIPRLSNLLYC